MLEAPPREPSRLPQLDGLRGIAAFAVMCFHLIGVYNDKIGHAGGFRHSPYVFLGYYGVHIFFIISGFVILSSVEKRRSALDFAVGRAVRLYPTYWVVLPIAWLVPFAIPYEHMHRSFGTFALNTTMMHVYANAPHVDEVYWSLVLELSFYYLVGILLVARFLERIELVALVWLLLELAMVLLARSGVHLSWRVTQLLAANYAHLFIAGLMLYRMRRCGRTWLRVGLFLAAIPMQLLVRDGEYGVLVPVLLGLVALAVAGKIRVLELPPIVFFGSISYAVYLVHRNVGFTLMWHLEALGAPAELAIVAAMAASTLLAFGVTRYIDEPVRRRVMQWYRARRPKICEAPGVLQ